ncbi:MAG: tRNA pseudouridine(38-40) synthase TruA [Methanobacteriota archaeon]|nr:MAG: tRNA pseudouridine(38-40) synthase TruA [Euryarchaeota archaeon]
MKRKRVVAVKVAYDGREFSGFQRQPDRTTVESALIESLRRVGAIGSAEKNRFRSSSRTDRGVSAVGNVVSFVTSFPPMSLCSAMNSELRGAWAYAIADVPDDFNPRWARQRWYRYHLPKVAQDVGLMEELASGFEGTHDFSAFARRDDRNPVRKIDSIDVSEHGRLILLDFRAENFLWNMVRRIVWVLDAASRGEVDPGDAVPEKKPGRGRTGLASPEPLTLMDVDCGVEFTVDAKAAEVVVAALEARIVRADTVQEFSQHLLSALRPETGREG